MTVNDILNLLALREKVLITGYESGHTYYEGLVEDVPDHIKMMVPHALVATAGEYVSYGYVGYDSFIQIEVDE